MGQYTRYSGNNVAAVVDSVHIITKPKVSARELERRAWAKRGKEDLYFFNKVILNNPVLYAPLHKPICRWLETYTPGTIPYGALTFHTGRRKKLFLMPRGHIKSNLGTVGQSLQDIVKNPNVRILIGSHKMKDAQKFLCMIRTYLESDRFRYFYPEIKPKMSRYTRKPSKWSDEAILLERSSDFVESTVECSSSDAEVVGRHYDRFRFDDLVTEKSVTEAGLKETKRFHQSTEGLADPGLLELITGTRYDYADRYGEILDTPEIRNKYDVVDLTAFVEQNERPSETMDLAELVLRGTPIFPTRFTTEPEGPVDDEAPVKSLPAILDTSGAYFFNTQYMNRPQDPTKQTFTEQLLQTMYCDSLPQDGEMAYFRVCDLSGQNETGESFTAIVTGCVDHNACIYITDIIRGNFTASWIMEELFRGQEVADEFRPKLVGFEPSMFEKVLKNVMERLARARHTWIPVKLLPVSASRRSKPDRIRGLEAWITNGKFKVLRTCRNKALLHNELYRQPSKNAVDIADASAMIPIFMFPGRKPKNDGAPAQGDYVSPKVLMGQQRYIGQNGITNRHIPNPRIIKLVGAA